MIRVVYANGTIGTFCGGGTTTPGSVGVNPRSAYLYWPNDIAVDSRSSVYINQANYQYIARVSLLPSGHWQLNVLVGAVAWDADAFAGDGTPISAGLVRLAYPYGIGLDNADSLFIADTVNNRIRQVLNNGTMVSRARHSQR